MKKKTVKEVKMHNFLVCACKSQDFAQSQKNLARSHDRETVTFRNSAYMLHTPKSLYDLHEYFRFSPQFFNIIKKLCKSAMT